MCITGLEGEVCYFFMLTADEKLRIEATIQHELKYACPNDCVHFIESFCFIEDVDSLEVYVPFKLWSDQKRALFELEANRLNIFLKSRQIGATWTVLAYCVWKMLFKPGYKVLVVSATENLGFKVIDRMKVMISRLPKWMVRIANKAAPNMPTWEFTKATLTIKFPNGEMSTMETVPCSAKAAKSFTVNLLIFDEWAEHAEADKVWKAAYPTINRPTGGKFIGISTIEFGTLYHEVWELAYAGENEFHPIFIPWTADPRRDQAWYESTKRDFPETYMHDYPATPEEAVSKGDAVAFPEFDRKVHVCKTFEPPEHWRKFLSVDNGYSDPFFWLWFAINEDGTVYVYREYTRDKKDPKESRVEQAESVVHLSSRPNGTYEKLDYCVAGVDAWNTSERDNEPNRKILDYYDEGGLGGRGELAIGFIQALRDRRTRKTILHESLALIEQEDKTKISKIQIMDCCHVLTRHIPLLMKDKNDPEKVGDNSEIDHSYDALTYGLASYYGTTKKPKEDETFIQRQKRLLKRKNHRNN